MCKKLDCRSVKKRDYLGDMGIYDRILVQWIFVGCEK
jgi:hypothetical protein